MLKKLHSLKSKKGFTLVELIIVIAIIAVLAAILIPTMMGFVEKSRITSNNSTAAKIKDAITTAVSAAGERGVAINAGTITFYSATASDGTTGAFGGTSLPTDSVALAAVKGAFNGIRGGAYVTLASGATVGGNTVLVTAVVFEPNASAAPTSGAVSATDLGTVAKGVWPVGKAS